MKGSLLARAAPALLMTAIMASGVGATAFAQTAAAPAMSAPSAAPSATATPSSGSAATATSGAATMPHHAATTQRRTAARRTQGQTMLQMAEARITDLHARMHVTAEQQSQWDQFAQVMRDNAKDLDTAYQQRAANFDKMNAVENMQSYAQIEQMRAQDLQKLVPAFQTLYSSLSDSQKQQADQLFRNQAAKSAQRHGAAAAR